MPWSDLLAKRRCLIALASLTCGLAWSATARAQANVSVGMAGWTLQPTSSKAPPSTVAPAPESDAGVPEPTGEPTGDDPSLQPTSSKAPSSAQPAPDPYAPVEEPEDDFQYQSAAVEPEEGDSSLSLNEERSGGSARGKPFNRHGVGVRGGIVVIPTWIISKWVDTHTNALCRGESLGDFAADRGLLKTDGCNFYIGGQYVYRQSRILDIVGSMGYQSIQAPDGYWLDELSSTVSGATTGNPLTGADYTEVDLHMMYIEADFIARAPIVVRENVEFGLGGGAGVGLGILFGGVWQTPIGSNPQGFDPQSGATPGSCQVVQDLADLRRCTPRWDPEEDPDGQPPPLAELQTGAPTNDATRPWATCTKDSCSEADLSRFGYREKNDDIPPVIPVVNLIVSARVIIKDTFAITVNGGFNTGFYFGGALTYFFGKQFQKVRGDGDTGGGRASAGPGT